MEKQFRVSPYSLEFVDRVVAESLKCRARGYAWHDIARHFGMRPYETQRLIRELGLWDAAVTAGKLYFSERKRPEEIAPSREDKALSRQAQLKENYLPVINEVISARSKGVPWASIQVESDGGGYSSERLKQIVQKAGMMPKCVEAYKNYQKGRPKTDG